MSSRHPEAFIHILCENHSILKTSPEHEEDPEDINQSNSLSYVYIAVTQFVVAN